MSTDRARTPKGGASVRAAMTPPLPRAVRCPECGDVAREVVRERVSPDEIAVRYGCDRGHWRQSRQYHESELTFEAA